MSAPSTTDEIEASAAVPCSACGRPFKPRLLPQINKWTKVCCNCFTLCLAQFMEESEPGDSLADISAGEQTGAMLREIARPAIGKHGGLSCHVCGNLNPRCSNCGGDGTPWLI